MAPISTSPDRRILLVGPGEIGADYVRTLGHLGVPADRLTIVGRGRANAEALARAAGGATARWGGLASLEDVSGFDAAIVAVPPQDLPDAARRVMDGGVGRILLEKPGALSAAGLADLAGLARDRGCELFLAYNRRFLPSVLATHAMIAEDGGVVAVGFDFSELESRIVGHPKMVAWGPEPLARFGLLNSSHIIDLFTHLAGDPAEWTHRHEGGLPWHPASATFCGSGITNRGALFGYTSTWNAAGRWGMEITTPRHWILLRPLEAPVVQGRDGFALTPLPFEPDPLGLRPGLPRMVRAFLDGGPDAPHLCIVEQAVAVLRLTETICGYPG